MSDEKPRLTQLSHGGGCGCKIAPAVLQKILAGMPPGIVPPQLLVGTETSDDAAVYQINAQQAIVATTDFFMPIVDDPFDFGRIAATNAISDVYAMGGTPLFALALVGMPVNVLPLETIGQILAGGDAVCRAAGIPIAGGHTIDSVEPIYGLVAIGLVNPDHLKRNSGAKAGDKLILGKPIGVGTYSAALKKDKLHPGDYAAMVASTTQLNTPGPVLACLDGVHAVTDVTGFGLLGHLLEVCKGSKLRGKVKFTDIPLLPRAQEFAEAGVITGASGRNWASYGQDIVFDQALGDTARHLLTDPQTSGGLLVACAPDTVTEVLSIFLQQGFSHVSVIGEVQEGQPGIEVY
ncbi:selenide, water dikinase SelD [Dechloromonas denitrificans]|uniref:selenide, water dikinase SelD n=1 Tax=Dechloromonas denitrificans TaxID=281362 RepID=UPI001CF8E594|nr:selenide, water dikinase SelD [Dechloromonas denitrificans]UCV10718.1 selenide, water dikinase SelD [Dechloromonas denitrificans]